MTDWRSDKRRHYSLELKKQILAEAAVPGVLVASVARRHSLNSNLIFNWRRRFSRDLTPAFAPVVISPAVLDLPEPAAVDGASSSRMEVICHGGRRIVLSSGFDAATLGRLLSVVEGR